VGSYYSSWQKVAQVIKESLDAAKCVIVLWSQKSVSSEWVNNEAAEGAQRQILVPILIDDVEIPFEFRRIHAAHLEDFQGALPNPQFDLLLNSISEKVGRPAPKQNIQKKSSRINDEPLNNIKPLGSIMQITNRQISRILPDDTRIQFRFKEQNYETRVDTVKYKYPTLNSIFTVEFKCPINIWVLKELYFKDEDGWHPLNILKEE